MHVISALLLASLAVVQGPSRPTAADDWRAFRGTHGSASVAAPAPVEWSDSKGIAWRTKLPGPGASSPIIVGDSVFVTCWSGYGLDRKAPGKLEDLRRHLLRVRRADGRIVWSVAVEPVATEDTFGGRMAGHGYASSTPVSDGEHVYVFFGKSGVLAFDLDGEQLWHADVGRGSSRWKTGSGSSLALWRNLVLVNASDESHALRALDKRTGRDVWYVQTEALDQAYATPVVTRIDGDDVLLFPLLGEIWALDPASGKTRWELKTKTIGALAPTVIASGDMAYSFGGRGRVRAYAVRAGGRAADAEARVAWTSRYGPYVATPLLFGDHFYWADREGMVFCSRRTTGELVFRHRLDAPCYASVVRARGAIYVVTREAGTWVLAAKPELRVLAHNVITSDRSSFDATPAFSRGEIFLRSRTSLYCIREP